MPDCVVYCCACGSKMDANPALPAGGAAMSAQPEYQNEGTRSFVIASILCALPIPGLVRFYTGYPFIGLFQLIIYPIGFIWSFVDLVRILTNSYKDSKGMSLRGYSGGFAGAVAIVVALFTLLVIKEAVNSPSAKPDAGAVAKTAPSRAVQSKLGTGNTAADRTVKDTTPVYSVVENLELVAERRSGHEDSAFGKNAVRKIDKTSEIEKSAKLAEAKKRAEQAKIANLRITTYPETAKGLKKAGYPKMLSKYGVNGIKKINRLLPKVAEKAAQNPSMDKIAWVDVSDNKSTKNKLVFYAQANNSNRVYISEDELNSNAPVYSNHEKLQLSLLKHEQMCEQVIKSCLIHPSTYKKSMFDSASETQEYTNFIRIAFSAKNSFNQEIKYVAIFRVNVDGEIVYQNIEEKK